MSRLRRRARGAEQDNVEHNYEHEPSGKNRQLNAHAAVSNERLPQGQTNSATNSQVGFGRMLIANNTETKLTCRSNDDKTRFPRYGGVTGAVQWWGDVLIPSEGLLEWPL